MNAESWESLLARHEAFLHCQPIDRPLLGEWVGGYYPAEQFPHGHGSWNSDQLLDPSAVRCAAFCDDYQHLYKLHQEAEDDFFYVGSAYWGIPWLEAILGCPIHVGTTSCWAAPCLSDPPPTRSTRIKLADNGWFDCLVRFTQTLLEFADGRFPVCPPLLRGPGDAVAALCGSEQFILGAMQDAPWFRPLLEDCAEVRLEVLQR